MWRYADIAYIIVSFKFAGKWFVPDCNFILRTLCHAWVVTVIIRVFALEGRDVGDQLLLGRQDFDFAQI